MLVAHEHCSRTLSILHLTIAYDNNTTTTSLPLHADMWTTGHHPTGPTTNRASNAHALCLRLSFAPHIHQIQLHFANSATVPRAYQPRPSWISLYLLARLATRSLHSKNNALHQRTGKPKMAEAAPIGTGRTFLSVPQLPAITYTGRTGQLHFIAANM